MEWEVVVKLGQSEGRYTITADKYYVAKRQGLFLFLEEFRIPGRPYEYLTLKRELVNIKVKSLEDKRTGPRPSIGLDYYLGVISTLRRVIRTGYFDRSIKKKSVELLQNLEETLVGTASR